MGRDDGASSEGYKPFQKISHKFKTINRSGCNRVDGHGLLCIDIVPDAAVPAPLIGALLHCILLTCLYLTSAAVVNGRKATLSVAAPVYCCSYILSQFSKLTDLLPRDAMLARCILSSCVRPSFCSSVRLSVRHTPVLYQNG